MTPEQEIETIDRLLSDIRLEKVNLSRLEADLTARRIAIGGRALTLCTSTICGDLHPTLMPGMESE